MLGIKPGSSGREISAHRGTEPSLLSQESRGSHEGTQNPTGGHNSQPLKPWMGAGLEKGSGKTDFILSSLASGTVCATSSPPTHPLVSTYLHNCTLLHTVGLEEDSLENCGTRTSDRHLPQLAELAY